SRRRHTRFSRDWSSDVCSSDLVQMRMDMAFGEGTPLTLHDGRLLLHFDHLDTGFLVMLDPATGREIWRTKRTEPYNWAAPYVAQIGSASCRDGARAPERRVPVM